MKCRYCGKTLKTYEGFRKHQAKEATDYRQRRGFRDEYKNALEAGYKGTSEEYAWGRIAGWLDLQGKEREKEASDD